jgi:carboxypeptidase Q
VDLGRPPTRDVPAGADVGGAAVLVDVHDIGDEPMQVMRSMIAQQLARAGAVAMLIPSDKPNRMVYTSGWGFYPRGALPVLSIAREDALFLRRLLADGPVTLSLAVQNIFDEPTATERNVVAEIPGRNPERVVVVGAHFDSWDLGDGADDNGSGVAALVEAARILTALHVEPQATIRFVFFSGEEQANLGSRAYVQRHAGELDATRAFLMMDDGAQLPLGFKTNGRSELVEPLTTLFAPLAPLGAAGISDDADVESDNASFMAAGVPTLTLRVAHGDYDVRHHAIADTFDRIDPRHVALDTAVMATAAYLVANADDWRGRRQSLEQVKELFKKTGLTSAQELLFGPLSR